MGSIKPIENLPFPVYLPDLAVEYFPARPHLPSRPAGSNYSAYHGTECQRITSPRCHNGIEQLLCQPKRPSVCGLAKEKITRTTLQDKGPKSSEIYHVHWKKLTGHI